jgi:hypothetical protein
MALLGFGKGLSATTVPLERVDLSIGEEWTIKIGDEETIHLSRKNIVDFRNVGKQIWRVIGLREGVALATIRDGNGDEVKQVLFTVFELKGRFHAIFEDRKWQEFVCRKSGIRCPEGGFSIVGTTEDYQWFEVAREECLKRQPCLFKAKLTGKGLQALETQWRRRLEPWQEVSVDEGGRVVISEPCSGKEPGGSAQIDFLSGGGVDAGTILVVCKPEFANQPLMLVAKAFLVETRKMQSLGISWGDDGLIPLSRPLDLSQLDLRALERQGAIHVIAEPMIWLENGQQAMFHDGGEVLEKIHGGGEGSVATWKKYGFIFKTQTQVLGSREVVLGYEVEVSQVAGAGGHLKKSMMKSQTKIAIGKEKLLGLIKNFSLSNQDDGLIFSRIPILGPLFKSWGHGISSSHLFLWVKIVREL